MRMTNLGIINSYKDSLLINGYGVGETIIQTFFLSIIYSFDNGLFTMASQAFGAKEYKLCGEYLQKS